MPDEDGPDSGGGVLLYQASVEDVAMGRAEPVMMLDQSMLMEIVQLLLDPGQGRPPQ